MASHAHSIPVPAPQRGLLRAFAGCLPALRSAASLVAQPWPLAAPESTAAQPCKVNDLAPEETVASTALTALLPAPLPSLTSAFAARRAIFGSYNG